MREFRAALIRVFRLALLALALTLPAAGLAQAATPAEDYIQSNIQRGLDILNNKSLAPADRRDQFRGFLESLTDLRRVALFTLGSAARTASDADKDAFVTAFHDYAVAVYNERLSRYNGQVLKVTGSTENAPGDFTVRTVLVDRGNSTEVDFRVEGAPGQLKLLDASVEGIWLSIEERDQFSGFLGNHGGDIHALIQHLNALTAQMRGR
jgi:phospholipid transport system substrate-binding protein